jgi:hypothetical protein
MPAPAPAEEAEVNDNRPEAEHLPDAGKKSAIGTAASSIERLEKQENIMAQDEDDQAPDTQRRNMSTLKRSAHLLTRSWRQLAQSGRWCT